MTAKALVREKLRSRIQLNALDTGCETASRDARVKTQAGLNGRVEIFFAHLFDFLFQLPRSTPLTLQHRWSAFAPHSHEPDISNALDQVAKKWGVEWVFPRVLNPQSPDPEMEFYLPTPAAVSSEGSIRTQSFLKNTWGLAEPNPNESQLVECGSIEGFLIPALAFDSRGVRLGRGKGYFDRYLARPETRPEAYSGMPAIKAQACHLKTKIGIAFDDQILSENLEVEAHDITMDIVLSESRCLVSQKWWKNALECVQGFRPTLRQAFPGAEFFATPPLNQLTDTTERA